MQRVTSVLFLAAATAVAAWAASGDETYARPGKLYSTGATSPNLYCTRAGGPAAVLDSAWGDRAPARAVLQPQSAGFTRACSYDRAGFQLDHSWIVLNAIRDVVRTVAFRDCAACPEMLAVPSGSFRMGSPAAEKAWAVSHGATAEAVSDEGPQHLVKLQAFAIGKYPVTRDEFAAFVRATGYAVPDGCAPNSLRWRVQRGFNRQNPGFPQSGRDPVVCVSWIDAQAYVAYLNRKVRAAADEASYRLPSESEWEYATRAGSTTRFWWGNDETNATSHAWFFINAAGRTRPVGTKPPNAFGIYDAVGNVWEWTADCYADSYAGAPVDGRPRQGGKECLRVDRGGSWLYPGWLLRSATRERNPAHFRDAIMGFRVAKSVAP